MVKPGKNDRKHYLLIRGAELDELQRFTGMMAESFGLDGRIDRYVGKRPIGLYRWDLECLLEVCEAALTDREAYPAYDTSAYWAMQSLCNRLRQEYEAAYGKD